MKSRPELVEEIRTHESERPEIEDLLRADLERENVDEQDGCGQREEPGGIPEGTQLGSQGAPLARRGVMNGFSHGCWVRVTACPVQSGVGPKRVHSGR